MVVISERGTSGAEDQAGGNDCRADHGCDTHSV
jgi:hypothetical protein